MQRRLPYALPCVASLLLACSGDPFSPPPPPHVPAFVEVTVSTTGPGAGREAYLIQTFVGAWWVLPGEPLVIAPIDAEIRLIGVADGCSAGPNPRDAVLVSGDTTQLHFDVACTEPRASVASVGTLTLDRPLLFGLDALGRSARLLGEGVSPAWSPDGELLAFVSVANASARIAVLDPDAGSVRSVSDALPDSGNGGPVVAWHPGGGRLAAVSGRRIVFLDPVLGPQSAFDPGLGRLRNLDWSPDGDSLVVASDSGLAIVAADGSAQRVLAGTDPDFAGNPAWSPDGQFIAYAGRGYPAESPGEPAIGEGLFIVATDGSAPRHMSLMPDGGRFAWSPDGSRIAYPSGAFTILVRESEGTLPATVLGASGWPSWTRDGRLRVHGDEGVFTFAPDGSDRTVVVDGSGGMELFRSLGAGLHWSP